MNKLKLYERLDLVILISKDLHHTARVFALELWKYVHDKHTTDGES